MTIFTSNRHERLLQNSLSFLQVWQSIGIFPSSCSQKTSSQGCAVTSVFLDTSCHWKYLMTWWGDYLLHSTLQRSSAAYSISVLTERSAFQDLPSPWWLLPDGPLSWRQPSLLITLHIQSTALTSCSAPPKLNHIRAFGKGMHMSTPLLWQLCSSSAWVGFCSLGNEPVPKWWNHSAQRPAVASEGCCDICVARGSGTLWHMEAGNSTPFVVHSILWHGGMDTNAQLAQCLSFICKINSSNKNPNNDWILSSV